MLGIFRPSPGSNTEPRLIALVADEDAFDAWLAGDDYTIERIERKTPHSRYGSALFVVHWRGHQVGIGEHAQGAGRIIDGHRRSKGTIYLARQVDVWVPDNGGGK